MRFNHPLWLVGFRPFFLLACLAGASLPLCWALAFAGRMTPPPGPLPPLVWHAHEMFYGFGWAMLGGFLLTATKNWVGIRGYHGGVLAYLSGAWVMERCAMAFGADWPQPVNLLFTWLFLPSIVALLLRTLIMNRQQDSFRDNLYFIVALPLFLPAKALLLSPDHFAAGVDMTLALFRLAFLLMLERTLTQFVKGAFQLTLPRHWVLDHGGKAIALLLAIAPWLPVPLAAGLGLLLAALLGLRWLLWRPWVALRRIDVGVMYLGYLAIVAQLVVDGLARLGIGTWVGAVGVHVFTLGAIGLITPAMVVRIAKGHTGRKVLFDRLDQTVLWLMIVALLLRVAAPQLWPAAYADWLLAAAACWSAAFPLLGGRYAPLLFRPRADGREH